MKEYDLKQLLDSQEILDEKEIGRLRLKAVMFVNKIGQILKKY